MHKLILFFVFVLLFAGCRKKDVQQPPTTPCNPAASFKAGFKMSEAFYSGRFADTDTIVYFRASFRADSTYTSYKWIVSNHTDTVKTQSFGLHFTKAELGKTIPVQLIATGPKNPCNPNDDGIDTVNRTLTIMWLRGLGRDHIYPATTLVTATYLGRWHGHYEDNPADTFTVLINDNGLAPGGTAIAKFYGFRVYNLPKGPTTRLEGFAPQVCENINPNEDIRKYVGYEISEVGYNSFDVGRSGGGVCLPYAEMFGTVDNKLKTIRIGCIIDTLINATYVRRGKVFIGKKIQ